jgi:hypothetical protein
MASLVSELVSFTRRRVRELAESQVRRALARLAPPTEHAALPRMNGPELARHRLTEAAGALLGKGATQAEAFRLLRLELNRLEQGGLGPRA